MARTINVKEFEKKKNRIMAEALKLIEENGYLEFSINKLIDRCNISKSSFFHHFQSKDILIEGILDWMMHPISKAYEKIVTNDETSAKEKLREMFLIAGQLKTDGRFPVADLMLLLYKKENKELLHHLIERTFSDCRHFFSQVIVKGCEQGDFSLPHPLGMSRHFLRLSLDINEQIGRNVYRNSENPEDWNVLYEELLAFESLASQLFGLKKEESLYGLEIQNHILVKAGKKENRK